MGGTVGTQIGAAVGSTLPIVGTAAGAAAGGSVGALLGGISGGIGGAMFAQRMVVAGVESYFSRLDEFQRRELSQQPLATISPKANPVHDH